MEQKNNKLANWIGIAVVVIGAFVVYKMSNKTEQLPTDTATTNTTETAAPATDASTPSDQVAPAATETTSAAETTEQPLAGLTFEQKETLVSNLTANLTIIKSSLTQIQTSNPAADGAAIQAKVAELEKLLEEAKAATAENWNQVLESINSTYSAAKNDLAQVQQRG